MIIRSTENERQAGSSSSSLSSRGNPQHEVKMKVLTTTNPKQGREKGKFLFMIIPKHNCYKASLWTTHNNTIYSWISVDITCNKKV